VSSGGHRLPEHLAVAAREGSGACGRQGDDRGSNADVEPERQRNGVFVVKVLDQLLNKRGVVCRRSNLLQRIPLLYQSFGRLLSGVAPLIPVVAVHPGVAATGELLVVGRTEPAGFIYPTDQDLGLRN